MDCLCVAGNQDGSPCVACSLVCVCFCFTFGLHLCMFLFLCVMRNKGRMAYALIWFVWSGWRGSWKEIATLQCSKQLQKGLYHRDALFIFYIFLCSPQLKSGLFLNVIFCQLPQLHQQSTWCILFSNSGQNTDEFPAICMSSLPLLLG